MRLRPQGFRRSFDRGTCGPGIEPRKWAIPLGSRRPHNVRKATWAASLSRETACPCVVVDPGHARKHLAREPGGPMPGLGVMARGPRGESCRSKAVMHGRGKSDRPKVPGKPPNKGSWDACRRRRWREGAWPREICFDKTSTGRSAGQRVIDDRLANFRHRHIRLWLKALRRRSQRHRLNWARMTRLVRNWIPPAKVLHPLPVLSLHVRTQGRSPVR
jgi:hypothetical protein